MLSFIFNKRLFFILFIGFVIATAVGTLSHECGHWVTGKYFGFSPVISYAYTRTIGTNNELSSLNALEAKYANQIDKGINFPEKNRYEYLKRALNKEYFMITAGGPLQTILFGTTGLLLLHLFRRKYNGPVLSLGQWLLIYLSLFWLREVFNLITALILFITHKLKMSSDEFILAKRLHWNPWSIPVISGLIGTFFL